MNKMVSDKIILLISIMLKELYYFDIRIKWMLQSQEFSFTITI